MDEITSPTTTEAATKKTKRKKSTPASLVSPPGMGGIIGGDGYDFQKRYITCRLPEWLSDPSFEGIAHEGFADVDVRFNLNGENKVEHIQIKNHEVSVTELREVLAIFRDLHTAKPNLYFKFTLACPSANSEIRRLNRYTSRLRNLDGFYTSDSTALEPTVADIDHLISELKLTEFRELILTHLDFDVDLHNFNQDEKSCDAFTGRLMRNPAFQDLLYKISRHVYIYLLHEVEVRRGKSFIRAEIELFLQEKGKELLTLHPIKDNALGLVIHNWADGQYDVTPDFELNWCEHFERSSRRVPPTELWESLLSGVSAIESQRLQEKGAGSVRFRGACCISTGIAVGNIFREVGGWTIEMYQPQTKSVWHSDATQKEGYTISTEERDFDNDGDSIVVLMNIKGEGIYDVEDFLASQDISPKVIAIIQPPNSPGSGSIQDEHEAAAFSTQARDFIQKLRKKHRVSNVHLFFYGPIALATFLGHRLTSVGHIHLYEFQDPGYVASCILKT